MEKNYLNYDKTGTEYRQLMAQIASKLQNSTHSWEVDDELHTLWTLADHGDNQAWLRYASALLMEGKPWYNPEEAKAVLDSLIEANSVCS